MYNLNNTPINLPAISTGLNLNQNYSLGQEHDYAWGGLSQFFKGNMDEIRTWNITRNQTEIQSNMDIELIGDKSGLVAYYNCNQGIASGNNTSEISLTNSSQASSLNSTFNNLNLNGPTSNFILNKCKKSTNSKTNYLSKSVINRNII